MGDSHLVSQVPHRWKDGSPALGAWTLAARKTLGHGGVIDLKGALPDGLRAPLLAHLQELHQRYRARHWGGRVGFGARPDWCVEVGV